MSISLSDDVVSHFRLTAVQKTALKKLGIQTILDLLYHFPNRYGDTAKVQNIETLEHGAQAVVFGRIRDLETGKSFRNHIALAEGNVEDETGVIHCTWFNQPYIAKIIHNGDMVRIEGKVSERRAKNGGKLYFSNPKIETVNHLPSGVGDSLFGSDIDEHSLYPVYPESRGITSIWLYHALRKIFKTGILETIPEILPQYILDKYHLPGIKNALIFIHSPLKHDDAIVARKRFSFEEIFTIQLRSQRARKQYRSQHSHMIENNPRLVDEFIKRFPFTATDAQRRSIDTILADLSAERPMTRLLEGDVGSGKTAVAATVAFAVTSAKRQVAYMCPTEILSKQHFESFISYFSYLGIEIGLITSSGCRKFPSKVNPKGWTDISRAQLLKWVAIGQIAILVGTHALVQKSVKFKNLALTIIDEQHRFGISTRSGLTDKGGYDAVPHLLSMTATPIPRTLALTMYGDLDITLLDQSPSGRKPIITEIVTPDRRKDIYEHIRQELKNGRQAYVICPRIDEPDPDKELALNARSVKAEAKRLQAEVFPEFHIDIMHSRMKPADKEKAMLRFKNGETHILCATSVVEVGVNVPNATIIIIEGAERFGLAQLHQLRGRVLRSNHQAYCYAFAETLSKKSLERLKALTVAKNGFELAELDLSQRGPGALGGSRQWGISDIAMDALRNMKMVEAAHEEARNMIENDSLHEYPILSEYVLSERNKFHFE